MILVIAFGIVTPWIAAAGIAAISIPLVIHLLNRKRRKVWHWGAMRFLEIAFKKQKKRMFIERWILLLTRCLIVLLIGLSIAGITIDKSWLQQIWSSPGSREVHIVFDTSLSGSIKQLDHNNTETTRLAMAQQSAMRLINQLHDDDDIVLWGMGKPAQKIWTGHKSDLQPSTITQIKSQKSGHALSEVLKQIREYQSSQSNIQEKRVYVFSGFSESDSYLSKHQTDNIARDLESDYFITEPLGDRSNYQISDVAINQYWVLNEIGSSNILSLDVILKRYGSHDISRGNISINLHSKNGDLRQSATYPVTWEPSSYIHNKKLVYTFNLDDVSDNWYAIQISYVPDDLQSDSIVDDNTLIKMIYVDSEIHIGMYYVESDSLNIRSVDWLTTALDPFGREDDQIHINNIVSLNDTDSLSTLDVIIAHGNVIETNEWQTLKDWVHKGGIVWFLPDYQGNLASIENIVPSWRVQEIRVGDETSNFQKQSISNKTKLTGLSSDWSQLVKNINVGQYHSYSPNPDDKIWLEFANKQAIVVSRDSGFGRAFLWLTTLDENWSNLVAKPFFVALVQESLRGTLNQIKQKHLHTITHGNDANFDYAQQWSNTNNGILNDIKVSKPQSGLSLYIHQTDMSTGNTVQTQTQHYESYWNNIGRWQVIDWKNPEASLLNVHNQVDITSYLLLLLLILTIGEACYSLRMSYGLSTHHFSLIQTGKIRHNLHIYRLRIKNILDHWKGGAS